MANKDFSGKTSATFTNALETPIRIQFYKINLWAEIEGESTLKIGIDSSEEVAYYQGLADITDGLTVAFA